MYVSHYSNSESGLAFKKLCDICSEDDYFADKLLDHNTIDLAAYAEMLTLLGPIIAATKNQFKDNCTVLPLRDLLNVAEEAFALLVLENCFNQWKWAAEAKLKAHRSRIKSPSSSSMPPLPTLPTCTPGNNHTNSNHDNTTEELQNSPNNSPPSGLLQQMLSYEDSPLSQSTVGYASVGCSDSDSITNEDHNDDNCTQFGPGYRYQYSHMRKDNRLGAGPWTKEGMQRYNTIAEKVIASRKVRGVFEEHLTNYFKEQRNKHPLLLTKKRKTKAGDEDEDRSPRKVVVIDLFTEADD